MSPRLVLRLVMLTLALVGGWAGRAWAQSSALDLIPANAAAAIVIRHPDELRKKGDAFLKKAGLNFFRPTDALDFVKMFLGINEGLDMEQASAAILLRSENAPRKIGLEDLNESLYFSLAFTDLDKMAANYGFAKGELKRDVIVKTKGQNQQFGLYVLARGKHLHSAASAAPLERLRKAQSVTGELSPVQRQTFGSADFLVFINPRMLGDELPALLKRMEREFDTAQDPQEKQSVGQFMESMATVRFALGGVRVGEGLGISFLTVFPKEKNEAARAFLSTLRTSGSAHLKSLPAERVIAAQAYAGDSAKNAIFARALFNFLLKDVLEKKHITSATDRPAFTGVFNELWQRLEGSRIGAYLTRDESKLGLFSLVAILDTKDAETFLADMRTLAKIADGTLDLTTKAGAPALDIARLVKDLSSAKYQTRAAATTRLRLLGEPALAYLEKAVAKPPDLETARRAELLVREISAVAAERRKELLARDVPRYVRPSFAFVAKAETRAGMPVDMVHVKLMAKDQPATRQLQQLFGPDWDKLRLAVHQKQVVVLLGSEVELFETALANLKEGKAGLAESQALEGFSNMRAPKSLATFHLSVEHLAGLVEAQPRRLEAVRLTSFALSVHDAALQLDLYVPLADVRAMVKDRLP